MGRPITTFTLSKERAELLKLIADAHHLSVSGLLSRFISSEIQKGTISDHIPGYRIEPRVDHVRFGFDGMSVNLTPSDSINCARFIELEASTNATEKYPIISGKFSIGRRGRGLIIEMKGKRRSLSRGIACDLARLLRKAAAKARTGH